MNMTSILTCMALVSAWPSGRPETPSVPAMSSQEPASLSYSLSYTVHRDAKGLVTLGFEGEGFRGLGMAKFDHPNDTTAKGMISAGPKANSNAYAATYSFDGSMIGPEGMAFEFSDQGHPDIRLRLIIAPGETPKHGTLRLTRGKPVNPTMLPVGGNCDTWCFNATMTCTHGGSTSACCGSGTITYDDNNCSIRCSAC